MFPLIVRCLANDKDAWRDLWQIYDLSAGRRVRRLLVDAGFGEVEADDVAQEIYLSLQQNRYKRLRSFHGESNIQLCAWLRHVALNFTRDWIKKRGRAKSRERKALKQVATDDHLGATEYDVASLLEAFGSTLSIDEMAGLRDIIDPDGQSIRPESERTKRRKRKRLEGKEPSKINFVFSIRSAGFSPFLASHGLKPALRTCSWTSARARKYLGMPDRRKSRRPKGTRTN